jgi:hypothetical protein
MGFRIPDYNTTPKTKHNIFILSPTPFYFYSFPPFPYFFHPSYLPSVFIQYFFPVLSLPVSHFPASAPHVFGSSLFPRGTSCTFFLLPSNTYLFSLSLSLPLSLFPHLNLAIIFLSFALSLARYTGTSSSRTSHTPCCTSILLLVRISVPLAQLHTHPSSFRSQSFHFLTGIPVPSAVLLSLLLIRVLFLFSIALSQYPALFPSAYSVLELCRSLSRFHSQLAPLALFDSFLTMYPSVSLSTPSTHLKYFSCTLSTTTCSFHPQISAPYISTFSTMLSNMTLS